MKKILPIILLLLGAGGGVAAGYFLRPQPENHGVGMDASCDEGAIECVGAEQSERVENAEDMGATEQADGAHMDATVGPDGAEGSEYVALQRQMIVPIVSDGQVTSLVVMSLSIEVKTGTTTAVYDREPKLRDAFLQVLFRHANTGGFYGDFTSGEKMSDLRRALNHAATQVLGVIAIQVLVTDILRQET